MFDFLIGSNLSQGVKNLHLDRLCRQVHCSISLCQRVCGKSRWYRWDSSCLILGIFKSSNS